MRTLAAVVFGFVAGLVLAWNLWGPDAEADESTVRFARSVESISDSVVTLELLERNGCEAVAQYHERRLKDSVKEAGSTIARVANVELVTPDLGDQLGRVRDWAAARDLDELVEGSRKLIERARSGS